MGKVLEFRQREEPQREFLHTPKPIIPVGAYREERSLRQEYDANMSQQESVRQDIHAVADGAALYRRVKAWGGERRTRVTLSHLVRLQKTLDRSLGDILNKLYTTPSDEPDRPERTFSKDRYKRTERWRRERGYIKDN